MTTISPPVASIGDTVVICDPRLTGVTDVSVGEVDTTFTTTGTCVALVIPSASSGPIVILTDGGSGFVSFPFNIIPIPGSQVTQIVET
jgi:hypothetical protein